jgi:hypothetical protein
VTFEIFHLPDITHHSGTFQAKKVRYLTQNGYVLVYIKVVCDIMCRNVLLPL